MNTMFRTLNAFYIVNDIDFTGAKIQGSPGSVLCCRIIAGAFLATNRTARFLPFGDINMNKNRRSDLIKFYIFDLDTVDIQNRF